MKAVCDFIIRFKPDVIVTEKGVSGMYIFKIINLNRFILPLFPKGWNLYY